MTEALPDHIEEYVHGTITDEKFLDLFEAKADNVDLRTDLAHEEISLINKIKILDSVLKESKIGTIYSSFLDNHMRLNVSLDRKSRGEFVDVNRKDRFDQNLTKFGNFANLMKVKE